MRIIRIVFSFALLAMLFLMACGEKPEANLQSKAALVDSLVIKGRRAQVANLDSLRDEQHALAVKYTAKLDPEKVKEDDLFAAAQLFYYANKLDSAITVLQKYCEKNDDVDALDFLFNAYIEKNRLKEAEKLFQDKLKKKNKNAVDRYYLYLYYTYQENGDTENAMRVIDEALSTLDKQKQARFAVAKAELLWDTGKHRESLALLKKLQKEYANDEQAIRQINAKTYLFELINHPAPELRVDVWLDSDPLSLRQLRGKVVLLDFWAPWCAPCRAMFPHLKKLYNEYHDKGLVIIGVTKYYGIFNQLGQNLRNITPAEELEWIKKFKAQYEIPFPYAVAAGENASKNFSAYGVYGIPHMVLIDKKGKVRYYAIGSGKSSEETLEKGVKELIAE